MSGLSLTIDASKLQAFANRMGTNLPQLKNKLLQKAAAIVADNFRNNIPVRTGKMLSTATTSISGDSAIVSEHSGYGLFVDRGAGPHIIRGLPLLAFEKEGKTIFAHFVRHPGYSGAHFVSKTLAQSESEIDSMIKDELNSLLAAE
jgi:hypothetical protein